MTRGTGGARMSRVYDFPHSERFPRRLYLQHPEKPWIYIRKRDGGLCVDSNQLARTKEFREQLEKLGEWLERLPK
jgi:hypothetical protein